MANINLQMLKLSEEGFFKFWLLSLQPFLRLRPQELDVLSRFLYYRYRIMQDTKGMELVETLLFSPKVRSWIKQDLDMKTYAFNNILSSLRKKGMIVDNTLLPKLIPSVEQGFKNFKLVYDIEIIQG